ncbi:uncharacterized protein MYCFIDRAFT_212034 [Pseudocercospora fijiensis CIRAD86]|uniref:NAD(P)-binding domain-containing protein n=1 Tax=Pseudocercospora fijiensis (strain CIRAD86) TaxID=383855 RepID=M3A6V2_PSEFD|nr:uncharacterized protein MYCFIDRAFT_212034 [Pseudocercospora fijiensis CIRAD86]EME80336.1 hypothetical protein MYCFIDRAFT_212034 [Pseudocercospora fijiensis CIRAD86]
MPSQQPQTKTIAFFGATGGCAGHCLYLSLNAGYTCRALARTPSKLTNSLKSMGISSETLDKHLTIIPGNAKNIEDVQKALSTDSGEIVDVIISGVGGAPHLQWSLWKPVVLDDPKTCQDAGRTVLQACHQLTTTTNTKKPLYVNISTTGISRHSSHPEDVPWGYRWFYHYVLQDPHEDKRVLEQILRDEMEKKDESERGIAGYVNVKPTLLFDGESRGINKIREGRDDRPVLGYVMNRKDVGVWMFERTIREDLRGEFVGRSVTLAY